jgi:hypothetical protein
VYTTGLSGISCVERARPRGPLIFSPRSDQRKSSEQSRAIDRLSTARAPHPPSPAVPHVADELRGFTSLNCAPPSRLLDRRGGHAAIPTNPMHQPFAKPRTGTILRSREHERATDGKPASSARAPNRQISFGSSRPAIAHRTFGRRPESAQEGLRRRPRLR